METKVLSREAILKCLVDALEPLDYVNAMWQCGSAAFKRVDDWSDIDIIVDVEDDRLLEVFKICDAALESLAPIEKTHVSNQALSPGACQKAYKFKGTSKYSIIEICAVKNSSPEKFLQREIHGDIIVCFDKKNVTVHKPLDKKAFAESLKNRLLKTDNFFNLYQFLVDKELNRHNYIEALAFYNNFCINPLLLVLRMKYKPFRFEFKTRYIYYDLPADVVKEVNDLFFVKDGEDLRLKHEKAIKWFNELVSELKALDLEALL